MGLLLAVIFWKIGSKRVIGGFTGCLLCFVLFPIGIFLVLNSRRLDDEEADAALLKEFATPLKVG